MSTIQVTNLRGRNGSPNLPDGAVVTGVVTATSFSGSGIGTAIKFDDGIASPFSYVNPEYILEKNITFDTTNAGAGYSSIVMSTIPTITVKSGVGMTVGVGKTLVIDVLQIGDL